MQNLPVTHVMSHRNNWTHVLLFLSLFSAQICTLVTEGGWPRSKDKPPHFSLLSGLLLVIKNTPKGKCQNFFLCIIFNFPFWVMQWSLPQAAFFLCTRYFGHIKSPLCVTFFFIPILWHLTSWSGCPQEKGQTQKQHSPMLQLCNDGKKRNIGKASQLVWRVRLFRSHHQTFICVISTDSQAEPLIKGR